MTLHFKDLSSAESRQAWWKKETADCAHSYPIPNHNMPEARSHLQFKRRPRYAVDIGANVGTFSAYASPHFEQVYGFEALSQTYAAAAENLSPYSNVQVTHLAAAAESDINIRLYAHEDKKSGSSTCCTTNDAWELTEYEETKTISLADIYSRYNIDYIDYLKVDCEGSEYAFLMNKDLSKINFLAIELHPALLTPEQFQILQIYLDIYFQLKMMFGDDIYYYESRYALGAS
tara:strand:+ start:33540 stop:34235 length:696 start_codon:yes stop_codon:yes gene_type:complete